MSIVQKIKKRFNRFLLDNQNSYMFFVLILFFILVATYLLFSGKKIYEKYDTDIALMNSEIKALQEILEFESKERQNLVDEYSLVEIQLQQLAGELAVQNDALRQKDSIVTDLKNGYKKFSDILRTKPPGTTQTQNQPISPPTQRNSPTQPKPPVQPIKPTGPKQPEPEQTDIPPIPIQSPKFQNSQPKSQVSTGNLPEGPGEDKEKKEAVKKAFEFAWNSYKTYSWGKDELKPVSKTSTNWLNLGLTIVDSLDTLWIMDLKEEFQEARDWVANNLSFDYSRGVSLFETVIRELGGLLSAYEFSKDRVFLDKAEDLAVRLLKGFSSPSGLPYATVNLRTGDAASPGWTGGASILSEIGTVQLEFLYLAYHTNKSEYAKAPLEAFSILDRLPKSNGLYPLFINIREAKFQGQEISIGALGDSFYEYMVKLWLFTNKQAGGYKRMYQESSEGIRNNLVRESSEGFRYVGQIGKSGRFEEKMEHLTCFTGGMFAIGAVNQVSEYYEEHLQLGADITATCHEAYDRTQTKIGPEAFEFRPHDFSIAPRAKYYILRPETVESYFILWRTTKDPKYRKWAWEAFQAIERSCKVAGGYSGIHNVDADPVSHDDTQQSFFLAETLKYLYLIFCDDSVVPLDKYVFNTEAHPLGIITEPLEYWPDQLRSYLLLN